MVSGCTVPSGAIAGVGVDDQGRLIGYLRVCHDHIDGGTLYYHPEASASTDPTDNPSVSVGGWDAPGPVTEFAKWSLATPTGGWKANPRGGVVGELSLSAMKQRREYSLYGWTNDNSSSAVDVTFTVEEVSQLKPGQVLYWAAKGPNKDQTRDLNRSGSEAEFRRTACKLLES
jgi:hypothetical protein